MKIETVSIIYQHPRILLGMKKRGLGAGRYNGFGGEVEYGETLEDSAIRETLEEADIRLINPERMGEILFQFQTDEPDHFVHFFKTNKFQGTPEETDEMAPQWFEVYHNIPYDQMWEDDEYWLPLMLAEKKFKGEFLFNDQHQIVEYKINEVQHLE